ncbi:unnamed protein product [Didymodactylos carnosus]|uniref:Uncharacterized protein n=1 Tax=Didymodactylos carnosus TaxID=1234261 RepID=A0A814TD56_9BILA|nr:unnamed protein product [Didymodactylos carnosus]CAF1161648.1 unnamed protein product [Didymodactylos carnosus]CAF3923333.1 unnamed protein product [Didymodactylos carnosus]CAF3973377.1 unnamed protein product [Didymodactylos carnosus]
MLSDAAEEQKVPDSSVKTRSALLKHELDTEHSIDWTSWRILAKDSSSYRLLMQESLAILDKQPELNRTVCSVPLVIFPDGLQRIKPTVKLKQWH